jgi:hypothetical protein
VIWRKKIQGIGLAAFFSFVTYGGEMAFYGVILAQFLIYLDIKWCDFCYQRKYKRHSWIERSKGHECDPQKSESIYCLM